DMDLTGLDWSLFNYRQLEFHGGLNFLKAGIVFSDVISTVSPTYAKEIQTPYYGCGLEGVLAERRDRLFGIINGVDYDIWDPAKDACAWLNYDWKSVAEKKPFCKASLQRRFKFRLEPHTPLLGLVARLIEQKGVDLVCRAGDSLLKRGTQLAVLGEGEPIF